MIFYFILPIIILILIYILYSKGFIWLRMGSARLIWRRRILNGEAAKCKKANFTMKKVKHFKEAGDYQITLELTSEKGDCQIELLDCDHNLIMSLNQDKTSQRCYLYAHEKYYLRVNMQGFYGDYQVHFEKLEGQ